VEVTLLYNIRVQSYSQDRCTSWKNTKISLSKGEGSNC